MADKVTDMDGMLALSGATKGNSAMTIGHYSMGPDNYTADWRDHLFVHEYGHYIQTQRMGTFFFPVVALPSVLSAWKTSSWSGLRHSQRWFEVDASTLGRNHFEKKYGKKSDNDEKGSYFDADSFSNKRTSPYINPRTGSINQECKYPITSPRLLFWDFIII